MALKMGSYLLLVIVLQAELSSSFVQFPEFHKLLSISQLKKYFGVDNFIDVPDYRFVNFHLNIPNLFKRANNFGFTQKDEELNPKEIFISTQSFFGHSVTMELKRNDELLAPSFKAVLNGENGEEKLMDKPFPVCDYIGRNGSTVAALNSCNCTSGKGFFGIILLPEGGVQIQPVDQKLANLLGFFLDNPFTRPLLNSVVDILHLVFKPKKKQFALQEPWDDEVYSSSFPKSEAKMNGDNVLKDVGSEVSKFISIYKKEKSKSVEDFNRKKRRSPLDTFAKRIYNQFVPLFPIAPMPEYGDNIFRKDISDEYKTTGRNYRYKSNVDLYLELAVFFDQAGYEKFIPHVKSDEKLFQLLLGYINQIQALFYSPSLARKIQINLVRLNVWKKQPMDFPHSVGNIDYLLTDFCKYQAKKNPDSDYDPEHWDLALYISGLDFHNYQNGEKRALTLGLAPVGGVCLKQSDCVITEFGTVDDDGNPYITAGLSSTYVAAHEIGHNLGMPHDGSPYNNCHEEDHVMSHTKGSQGQTTWSRCSSEVVENINMECLFDKPGAPGKGKDHRKYNEKPGSVWNAGDQCKIFLKDKDARLHIVKDLSSVCEEVLCTTHRKTGYSSAGPALDGTSCGLRKWCQHGKCVYQW